MYRSRCSFHEGVLKFLVSWSRNQKKTKAGPTAQTRNFKREVGFSMILGSILVKLNSLCSSIIVILIFLFFSKSVGVRYLYSLIKGEHTWNMCKEKLFYPTFGTVYPKPYHYHFSNLQWTKKRIKLEVNSILVLPLISSRYVSVFIHGKMNKSFSSII